VTTNIVDYVGSEKANYGYDEYGVPGFTFELTSNDRRFAGEQRDADSGLSYLRSRYYDPATGRFLARDRVLGQMPYVYAGNNPVNLVHPMGTSPYAESIQKFLPAGFPTLPFSCDLRLGPELVKCMYELGKWVAEYFSNPSQLLLDLFDISTGDLVHSIGEFLRSDCGQFTLGAIATLGRAVPGVGMPVAATASVIAFETSVPELAVEGRSDKASVGSADFLGFIGAEITTDPALAKAFIGFGAINTVVAGAHCVGVSSALLP